MPVIRWRMNDPSLQHLGLESVLMLAQELPTQPAEEWKNPLQAGEIRRG